MTLEEHLRRGVAHAETAEIGTLATAKRFVMAPVSAFDAFRGTDGRIAFDWGMLGFVLLLAVLGGIVFQPFRRLLGDRVHVPGSPFIFVLIGYLAFCWILSLGALMSPSRRLREDLIRAYRRSGFDFSSAEFSAAAKALEAMTPIGLERGREKYGQRIMDVLILSGSVDEMDGKWRRIVSIRSIREDRVADERDDEE